MSTLDLIATKIIKEQELIIGPMAWQQAGKVSGLHVLDQKTGSVSIESNNAPVVVDNLVATYAHLFGQASIEVCKEAAGSLLAELSPSEVPASLR